MNGIKQVCPVCGVLWFCADDNINSHQCSKRILGAIDAAAKVQDRNSRYVRTYHDRLVDAEVLENEDDYLGNDGNGGHSLKGFSV